jgi:hypothetical protein
MSTLNYAAIDETYPVAGQDNNSQGFRGNFAAIKNAIAQAEADITTLETNTAKKNATNNFLGNTLTNATYNQFYGATYPVTVGAATQEVSLLNGPLQAVGFNVTGRSIQFTNWPVSGKYASIRVHLYNTNSSADINITVKTNNSGAIYITSDINVDGSKIPTFVLKKEGDPVVIEAWTYTGSDATPKIFLRKIGEFADASTR